MLIEGKETLIESIEPSDDSGTVYARLSVEKMLLLGITLAGYVYSIRLTG